MTVVLARTIMKDHWSKWPDRFCSPYPEGFNRETYQKALNEIAGLSRGLPILKLVWGGEEIDRKYVDWTMNGVAIRERIEPKYKLRRRNSMGAVELIPFRRWIIEQLCEPEQMKQEKFEFTNEFGFTCKIKDNPGFDYSPIIYVGDHSTCKKDCCESRLCPGDIKAPDKAEINWVAETTYKLTTERICDPRSVFGEAEMAKVQKEVLEEQEKLRQQKNSSVTLDERLKEIQP